MMRRPRPAAGFTLIEAIMVIAITGILAGIVAVFITKPVQGYVDAVRRAELTDAADVALRRMTRDVRLALPNSLRLKDSTNTPVVTCTADGTPGVECYIEFIMTKAGGRYRDPADGSTGGNFLDFTGTLSNPSCPGTPSLCFDILGTSPTNPPNIANGDSIVVYNLGASYAPADAYAGDNRTTVSVASGTPYLATMAANVFAGQSPPLPSPDSRFQVVGQGDKVVRFGCVNGALTRDSGCAFATTTTCANPQALLAGSASTQPKATCELDYQASATGRNGLLYVKLTLTDTPSGESVSLFQQIHVDNAP